MSGKVYTAEILIIAMIVIMYGNNIYHGKLIIRLNEQGKSQICPECKTMPHIAQKPGS